MILENAGKGGNANSGSAVVNRGSEHLHGPEKFPQTDIGNSYTGEGGDAGGGWFLGEPGVINLFSSKSQCYTALPAHTTTRSQCRRRRIGEQRFQWCFERRTLMGVPIAPSSHQYF